MPKYELIKQKYSDQTNKSWSAERADTIETEVLGEYNTVGMAATFRSFLIKEKKYGDEPMGLSASTAFYIREKVESAPTPEPAHVGHGAVLQFQGNTFNLRVYDAMRLKALLESFIPGATVLVSPSEAAEEV